MGPKISDEKQSAVVHCPCNNPQRGIQLVRCESCQTWYHFECIRMASWMADELVGYVCERCQLPHQRTTLLWEDFDQAYFNCADTPSAAGKPEGHRYHEASRSHLSDLYLSSSESVVSEGYDSRSDSWDSKSVDFESVRKDGTQQDSSRIVNERRLPSTSPRPGQLEIAPTVNKPRVASRTSQRPTKASRGSRKEDNFSGVEDPIRMYCLRKLQEVITPIFCESAAHEPDYSNSASLEGVSYVKELEQHLFQAFRETDKAGNILVGNKYKTQFRMLAFNLEKSDRVSLRQSIRTGRMTAAELSVMSNSELASDQQKKEIETAQKESLEHSILDGRQMNRPLRKITHKGEEEIEDMDRDDDASRTRSVRGDSILYFPSAPSSEPSPTSDDPKFAILPSRKLVTSGSSASGVGGGEPEAFATPQSIGPPESTVSSSFAPSPTASAHPISLSTDVPPSIVASPTSKRFDLSSLGWAESDHHSAPPALETESPEEHPGAPPSAELDTGEDARSDHDFNMFIEPEHERNELTPAEVRDSGVLQSSPPAVVWKGELRMPGGDGSTMSTEIASYLIAGRPKGYQDFSFWSSMFPRPFVRVDGRVNIDAANTYLLNSRLNTGRELVAVEMVPSDPQHEATFNEIVAVLTSKRRHGVVFPWGNPAPPDAPGKELYLVPLQPSDPVPEYLQLLDHVQLPDVRTATVVLGFFILHRSKVSIAQPATNIPVSAQATRENGTASNVLQPSVPSGIDISSITAEYLAGILQNPALNQTLNPTAPPSSVMALYPQSSNTDTPNSGAPGPSQPLTLAQTLYSGPSTPAVINQQMGRFRGDAQSSSRGRPYENYSRGRRYALDGSRGRGRGRNAGWGHANYSPVDNGWGNRRSSGSGGSGGIRY